jgi:hypothetical protein
MALEKDTPSPNKISPLKIFLILLIIFIGILGAGMVWGIFDPAFMHMPEAFRQLINSL